MSPSLQFDIAHLLAGGMVLVSFMLLYQDRMFALIHAFTIHALLLAMGVAAGVDPGGAAPVRHRRHRSSSRRSSSPGPATTWCSASTARSSRRSTGLTMLAGLGLTALAILVTMPVTARPTFPAREDTAFALAVLLLGLLMMITRRNAVSQLIGFMSLENGLILAAAGAKGMPLVVELSVAFSVLIAFIVFGIFVFRIRERFDTVDVHALDRFRGDERDRPAAQAVLALPQRRCCWR